MRGRERRNARFIEKGYEVEDEKKNQKREGGLTSRAGTTLVHQRRESSRMANGRENKRLCELPLSATSKLPLSAVPEGEKTLNANLSIPPLTLKPPHLSE